MEYSTKHERILSMPTSPYGHIHEFVSNLIEIRPKSILDIGVGNGKMGFIARDVLDVGFNESYHKRDWKIVIDGIEVFNDYIQEHQTYIYDTVHIGDAFEKIDSLGLYELIIIGDVLEHFSKERGIAFFEKCISHTSRHIILCLPLGDGWNQPEIYGNPYEAHQSSWNLDEFKSFSRKWKIFPYTPGNHGIFLISKEEYIDFRIGQLKSL